MRIYCIGHSEHFLFTVLLKRQDIHIIFWFALSFLQKRQKGENIICHMYVYFSREKDFCLIDFFIRNLSKRIISKRIIIFMEFTVREESRITEQLSSRGVCLQFPPNLLLFRKFSPPALAAEDNILTSAPVQCLQSGFLGTTSCSGPPLLSTFPLLPVKLYHLVLSQQWPPSK